jgi:hypothetical protein
MWVIWWVFVTCCVCHDYRPECTLGVLLGIEQCIMSPCKRIIIVLCSFQQPAFAAFEFLFL